MGGFCKFYHYAVDNRGVLDVVWSDLFVHQYLPNLKMIDHKTRRYTEGSARDLIARDEGYEAMIDHLFALNCNADFGMRSGSVARTASMWLIQFPKPYTLQQRIFELKEPLSHILQSYQYENANRLSFDASILHAMSRDKQWRLRFMKQGGLNWLVRALFLLVDETMSEQNRDFGATYLASVLFDICYDAPLAHGKCERHVFLRRGLRMMKEHKIEMQMIANLVDVKERFLIAAICLNDSGLLTEVGGHKITFLDQLPRKAVAVETLPLITGYIRNECVSSWCIPGDVSGLIACFF